MWILGNANHSEGELEGRTGHDALLRLLHLRRPPDHSISAAHAVEVAPAAVGVGTHARHAQPVTNLQRRRHSHVLGDHVHPVASHSEESGALLLTHLHLLPVLQCLVELVVAVLEGDAVHDVAVETVVERFVEVVAQLSVFHTFAQYSGQQVECIPAEVPSWLSDHCVPQGVVLSDLERIDCLLVEVGRGEASSHVHDAHLVPILPSDLEAVPGEQDGLVEGGRAVHARTTVEVDALDVDAHILDLLHALVDLLRGVEVVAELVGEGRGQLVTRLLLDGDPPQDTHAGCQLTDLDELVNGVSSGHLNTVAFGPDQVALVLDGIRVDHEAFIGADAQHVLQLCTGGAVVAGLLGLQVVEQGQCGVGLDGVMCLDPGEFVGPVVELAHGLVGVVEEAAGLRAVGGDDGVDLAGLVGGQQSRVVALQEVERVGEGVLVNQQVALGKATTRDHFKQCEKLIFITPLRAPLFQISRPDHYRSAALNFHNNNRSSLKKQIIHNAIRKPIPTYSASSPPPLPLQCGCYGISHDQCLNQFQGNTIF